MMFREGSGVPGVEGGPSMTNRDGNPAAGLRVAYLVNQYPLVSHTFIRREIQALEELGVAVERISIRDASDQVIERADEPEAGKTRAILASGGFGLLAASLACLVRHPIGWCRGLVMAMRCGWRSHNGLPRHLVYFLEAAVLLRWLERDGVGHVHAHFGTNPATVAMLCRAMGGPRYSFTVHGPEEFDRPDALSLREKVAGAAFVVAISEFGRSQVFRWADYQHWSKVHVVRCAVDDSFLDDEPAPLPETPRLVCVGRLGPEKGQERLVEACAKLRDQGVAFELTLVGGGVFTERTQALIDRLRLSDRITITGWVDADRVRREINAARLMVMPTFAEGLPVVFMESLALGRPVLSTYVAGIPELVRPGETGWLIPAGSVGHIVQTLAEALRTPTERLIQMGEEGRRRVAEQHRATSEASKLAAFFRQAAGVKTPVESTARPNPSMAPTPAPARVCD